VQGEPMFQLAVRANGEMLASSTRSLYGARRPTGPWTRIDSVPAEPIQLAVTGTGDLLAATRVCDGIFRYRDQQWTLERFVTPIARTDARKPICANVLDLATRAAGDAFAASDYGVFVRVGGEEAVWLLDTLSPRPVWSIAETGGVLYVSDGDAIYERNEAGSWHQLTDRASHTRTCQPIALATQSTGLFAASDDCIQQIVGGRPVRIEPSPDEVIRHIVLAADGDGGWATFWEYSGAVALVRTGRVTVVRPPELERIGKARVVQGWLVVAGTRAGHGIIAARRVD
jgi:hypothetical protein